MTFFLPVTASPPSLSISPNLPRFKPCTPRLGPSTRSSVPPAPARFKPFAELTDDDFAFSLQNKLMGQVNIVRYGFAAVKDGGSITITSGSLGQEPMTGSGVVSLVNAGLEGFGRAAALEAPRRIRVNVVAPPWVTETLKAYGMPLEGGLPASTVAQAYVRVVEGTGTGQRVTP